MGERLAKLAQAQGILLMLCDSCALERGLATRPLARESDGDRYGGGVQVGCFPDLYAALASNPLTISLRCRIPPGPTDVLCKVSMRGRHAGAPVRRRVRR